jgi:hypothetical protein
MDRPRQPMTLEQLLRQPHIIVLPFKKRQLVLALLISVSVAGISFLLFSTSYYASLVGMTLSGLLSIVFVAGLLIKRPMCIINTDGIYDFRPFSKHRRFIAWDHIVSLYSNIHAKKTKQPAFIFITLKDKFTSKSMLKKLDRKLGYADVSFTLSGLNYKAEDLALLLPLLFGTMPDKRENIIKATLLIWARYGSLTNLNREIE